MEICFDSYYEMKKFCSKLFNGQVKDNTFPVFSECNFKFDFKLVYVDCDMTENELSQWLQDRKIKVNYVSKF